jgi:hypothetical protein
MNKLRMVIVIMILTFLGCQGVDLGDDVTSTTSEKNIFIAGQSNANATFAAYVQEDFSNHNIIQNNFSGNPIANWFDDGEIQTNLLQDLVYLEILEDEDPDVIIWYQGEADWNDPDNYTEDFQGMYDLYLELYPDLLFVIMQVWASEGDYTDEIRVIQESIAEDLNLPIFDTYGYDHTDLWHPSSTGYEDIADDLYDYLTSSVSSTYSIDF